MTMDYDEMVRTITQAYIKELLSKDDAARAAAAALMQRYGLPPEAADTIIETYSRGPIKEWYTSAAS